MRQAAQKIGIGRYAVNGNGAQPPSGKAIDRKTGGRSAAAAMASPVPLLLPDAYASPPIAVNRPATGLANGLRKASAMAGPRRSRWRASAAASPKAVPSANGRRLVARSVTVPNPSQSAPRRARSGPKCVRTSRSNSAAHATHEPTRSTRGPRSHESGAESTL